MSASLGKDRRYFIGGSDARVIMGDDEAALLRLWREKRGEVEPEDLSGNLIVQLGLATEKLNRRWYQANTGRVITDVQKWRPPPDTALDGGDARRSSRWRRCIRSQIHVAVVSSRRKRPLEKHAAQLQHNMWVVAARGAVLSIITGGGKWVEIKIACRSALPASDRHCRAEVLALRRKRRATRTIRRRAAEAAHRGGAHCRYELLERLGGVCCDLFADPVGPSRTRTGQGRAQELWCPMMRSRRSVMASEPSARNRAPSVSTSLNGEDSHAAVE